jgi:hypothetical protein
VFLSARKFNPITCVYCLIGLYFAGCGAPDTPSSSAPRGPVTTGTAAQPTLTAGASAVAAKGTPGKPGQTPGDFGSPTGLLPMPAAVAAGAGGCRPATVAFVIDGSGSMCEKFGNSTRWGELRAALVQKGTGLLYKINALATVGAYLYDGTIDLSLAGMATMTASAATNPTCAGIYAISKGMGTCPQIIEVKLAPMNAAKIDAMYPARELGGSTPTDKVMNHAVDSLIAFRTPGQDLTANPQFIILATDGQPNDICTGGMGGDGTVQQQGVIGAVDKAAQMGITTYVISLASDPGLQAHLDDVARHGNPRDPMARTFTPTNSADLIMTLTKILGTAVGCVF